MTVTGHVPDDVSSAQLQLYDNVPHIWCTVFYTPGSPAAFEIVNDGGGFCSSASGTVTRSLNDVNINYTITVDPAKFTGPLNVEFAAQDYAFSNPVDRTVGQIIVQ